MMVDKYYINPPVLMGFHIAIYHPVADKNWGVMKTECGQTIHFLKKHYFTMFPKSIKIVAGCHEPIMLCKDCSGTKDKTRNKRPAFL